MWRKVQAPRNPKGLAIGWLMGPQVDKDMIRALPGWAIILTDQAPLVVSQADIQAARSLGGCSASTPVGLMGWSAGVQSVRCVLQRKLVAPWAVACFDGTHDDAPPTQAWKAEIWSRLVEDAKAGKVRFLATATQMAYTKDIPQGKPGRAWPTSYVLGRALGLGDHALEVGSPVIDGHLYVELFQSPDNPRTKEEWADAGQAHRDQINVVAPRLLAAYWGADTSSPRVKPLPAVEAWLDPLRALPERLALWIENEWSHHYAESPMGSNDSPRIREYDQTPFVRDQNNDGQEDSISAPKSAWCAKMAGAGLHSVALPGDSIPPLRVSGIEYQKDAEKARTWIPVGSALPRRGDMAIFSRPGASWFRHVALVVGCTGTAVDTIGGNEADTIGARRTVITGARKDPTILGFIRI